MITKIGIGSTIAGLFLGIFAGISTLMKDENYWVDLTISKIIGEDATESFITITSYEGVQNILDSLMYELPMYGLLLGIGLLFLIVGLFIKNF